MTDNSPYNQNDPALSFRFALEKNSCIEGIFTECTGLQTEREVEEYKEGGQNNFVHKFPGRLKFSNIVLKKGMTTSNVLWEWYQVGKEFSTAQYENVFIILYDASGEPLKRWSLTDAFPVKWSGPDLKTDGSNVAIETIELAHHGIELIQGKS